MTILRDASTAYASLFSFIVLMVLFESRYSRKKTMWLTTLLMLPLLAINIVLLFIVGPQKMSTLMLITSSLPSLIFFFMLSKHRDGRFLFTFCLADTLVLEIIHITLIMDFFLGNTYYFMAASRLIVCPLMALAIYKWIRPVYLSLQNKVTKGWYTFSAIALIFYVVLSMFVSTPVPITQRPEQLPIFILLLVLMPAIYIHIFTTLLHQQQLYEITEKENILQVQVSSLCSRIDEFTDANETFKKERHDFRHKLRTIATLAENKRYDELRSLADEFADESSEKLVESYCSHTILDAVLSSYLRWAKHKGINVTTKISFPDMLPVNESELATVFANAIENAIHACEKIGSSEGHIEVIVLTEPCFMLQIRNSFEGIIAFDEKGIPITQKKGHGFGTKSIVAFCEKNNAFYEFKTEDKDFFLRIIFR